MTRSLQLLGLFTLLGAAARFSGLDVQSLWHDELFSWMTAGLPTLEEVVRIGALEDVHPPGFPLILRPWMALFGDRPIALRSLSALAGTLTLPALYLLGRRVRDDALGLRMAVLATFAWMPIYYAQEARPYALLLLGSTAFLELLLRPRSRSVDISLCVLGALLAYLHYFGLLLVALGFTAWWLRHRTLSAVLPAIGSALLYAPWLAALSQQVERGEVWIPPLTMETFLPPLMSLLQGGPLLVGFWAVGLAVSSRRRLLAGALLGFFVPVAAAVTVSLLILPVWTDRNLIIVVPFLLLATALSAEALEQWGPRGWATTLLVALQLFDLLGVRAYYSVPTKSDYRAVAEALASVPADTPVLAAVWDRRYLDYYRPADAPLHITATSTRKKTRRQVFQHRPDSVFIAQPIPLRRDDRCWLRQKGYRVTCISLTGWDLYEFTKAP